MADINHVEALLKKFMETASFKDNTPEFLSDYEWFIEPLNKETNEAIADYINSIGLRIDLVPGLKDRKGKSHDCFRLKFREINSIHKMRHDFFAFKVFARKGNRGPGDEFKLLGKKKKNKKVKEVIDAIKKFKK